MRLPSTFGKIVDKNYLPRDLTVSRETIPFSKRSWKTTQQKLEKKHYAAMALKQSRRHGGLPNKSPTPLIELWSTINRWIFCQISECQVPPNKPPYWKLSGEGSALKWRRQATSGTSPSCPHQDALKPRYRHLLWAANVAWSLMLQCHWSIQIGRQGVPQQWWANGSPRSKKRWPLKFRKWGS